LDAGKFEMFDVALRRLMLACVLVLAATVSGSAKTTRTSFDGSWSVLIITDAGTCDRTYRYGVRIAEGQMHYDGGMGVVLSGQVTPKGNVRVKLSQGDAVAQGSGRLSRSTGSGKWHRRTCAARVVGRPSAANRRRRDQVEKSRTALYTFAAASRSKVRANQLPRSVNRAEPRR
jgi:hypothetical protein